MIYFCKNIFFGCVFLLLLFLLYLYCLFIDSPLIHLKPLIVFPLLAFRVFLSSIDQKHWLFIMHPEFLLIKSQLEEPNNDLGWFLLKNFSLLCALCFIYLDFTHYERLTQIYHLCVESFQEKKKQIININNLEIEQRFESLKREKEQIFQYYYRKHLYCRAAPYIFESFKKTSKADYKKVKHFLTNLILVYTFIKTKKTQILKQSLKKS